MKSLKNSGAPDIKRISASIVIDSAREDVVLDEFTKRQIRNAVSGAIGFVEERDELVLSRAAFVDVPEPKVDQTEEILVEEVVPPTETASLDVYKVLATIYYGSHYFRFILWY